jgi:hypothetical protein
MRMAKMKLDSIPCIDEFSMFLQDTTSTEWHHAIVDKALQVVESIPEAEGVVLKGSLGKGEGDIFSDIDFMILHDGDPAFSVSISARFMGELERIGTVIHYFTSTASQEDYIIYFRPFVKFELNVKTCEQAGEAWRTSVGKILFDRRGRVRQVLEEAERIDFSIDDFMDTVRNRAIQIPTFCYITAGFIVRGEKAAAHEAIGWIRNDMLRLSGWLLGQWDEGPRRAEERFPTEVLYYYMRSQARTIEEVWDGIEVLLEWYENWLAPRFDELGILHALVQLSSMRGVLRFLRKKTE